MIPATWTFRLAAVALALVVHGGARATYSGLALIPTADVVGRGQCSIEWQMDGPAPADSPDSYFLNTQFGIGNRAEVGVDFDNSDGADPRLFLNAKIVVAEDSRRGQALALGVHNVADGARGWGYAVALFTVKAVRLHPGVVVAWRHCHAIAGVDAPVAPRIHADGRLHRWRGKLLLRRSLPRVDGKPEPYGRVLLPEQRRGSTLHDDSGLVRRAGALGRTGCTFRMVT